MQKLFDSHAHYYDGRFQNKKKGAPAELLEALLATSVGGILNVGTDLENSRTVIESAAEYEGMYAAVGIHPSDGQALRDIPAAIKELRELFGTAEERRQKKIVALGEIGLDYHYPDTDKPHQMAFFEAQMRLAEELGRDPSDAEIAEHLDFSERTVSGLRLADLRTISLHDPIQQGEEGEFQDIIPDRHAMTPDQIIGDIESVFRLMDLLDKLDERERKILEMRFGLRGGKTLTLEEVSQQIGRTRERVRQIQNQALAKLKQLLMDEAGYSNNGIQNED